MLPTRARFFNIIVGVLFYIYIYRYPLFGPASFGRASGLARARMGGRADVRACVRCMCVYVYVRSKIEEEVVVGGGSARTGGQEAEAGKGKGGGRPNPK